MKLRKIGVVCALCLALAGMSFAAETGDVNSSGTIDIVDALLVAQYYVGLNPQNFDSSAADVNCSGSIDIVDALLVAQYYVGLVSSFPCSTTPDPATATPAVTAEPTATAAPMPAGYLSPLFVSKSFKVSSTFWNPRVKNIIVNWIPWCYNQLSNTSLAEGGIDNFVQAGRKLAGQSYSAHVGYWFSPAYVLNTFESMCVALMVDAQGDAAITNAQNAMKTKMADWLPKILSAQESDGYFATWHTLGGNTRWSSANRDAHEGYVAGYWIEAGIAHLLATGDTTFYNAAKKLADCWYNNAPGKGQWWDGHEEMEQACTRLGRFVNLREGGGAGDKYIQLAKTLMDVRRGGGEYDQSHDYPINQREAVGHSVRAVYLYSAMTDVAMLTGNSSYTTAANALWDNLTNRKLYVTGGVGSGESSEGFGANYSLPNRSYCESCSSCGYIFQNHKMNMMYKDAKYADLVETTLYNALLGSLDLDARNYGYTNPLDQDWTRYNWHSCPCCVGNIPRTLLSLPTWMYSRSSDGIFVNLFIGSTVTVDGIAGTDVQVVQSTNYPWEGSVSITINPAVSKSFTVYVRVPDRSVSSLYSAAPDSNGFSSISLNGSAINPAVSNGYAAITRTWAAGDKIDIILPLAVQRIKAIAEVTADRDAVALQRGPIVFNIESADTGNTNLNDFVLDPAASLTAQWNASLLGGVYTLKSTFKNGTAMNAIPNYARNNRGGRSVVWIREKDVAVISPIAKAATPSASYTSSWESVLALNDQIDPVNSSDRSSYVWGCWDRTGAQWIQYDFDKTYAISRTDIYWFSDGGGLMAPASWSLQYWNGSSWVNVANPSGYGVALDRWNTCTFTSVSTSRIRLNINCGSASAGAIEWKVQ